jgi:hypothetical protein
VVESVFFPFPFFSFVMRVFLLGYQGDRSTQTFARDWNFIRHINLSGWRMLACGAKARVVGGLAVPFDSLRSLRASSRTEAVPSLEAAPSPKHLFRGPVPGEVCREFTDVKT